MIDVFLCTMDERSYLRTRMFDLTLERWKREENVNIIAISPSAIDCPPERFQSERRKYAEAHATSDIYIVADDDCLLPAASPIGTVVDLLAAHPDFAIISLWPENAVIYPWTPENYKPVMTDGLWEHVSVGNIRFCRKGLLKHWQPQLRKGYDTEQCAQIRAEGRRVGLARHASMIHLGEGYRS